jgi:hypothetical protein
MKFYIIEIEYRTQKNFPNSITLLINLFNMNIIFTYFQVISQKPHEKWISDLYL